RADLVTGVQTCALPISAALTGIVARGRRGPRAHSGARPEPGSPPHARPGQAELENPRDPGVVGHVRSRLMERVRQVHGRVTGTERTRHSTRGVHAIDLHDVSALAVG